MHIHEAVQPWPQSGISYSGDPRRSSNTLIPQHNWYPLFITPLITPLNLMFLLILTYLKLEQS